MQTGRFKTIVEANIQMRELFEHGPKLSVTAHVVSDGVRIAPYAANQHAMLRHNSLLKPGECNVRLLF